jgi:apolipoprotein N-acyltransferase
MRLEPGLSKHVRRPRSGVTKRPRPRPLDHAGGAPLRGGGLTALGLAAASGVAVSVAWWLAGTVACAVLGWIAAALLIVAIRSRRAYLPAYVSGVVCCALGFYWVFDTVNVFAGLGTVVAALVFALFVVLSAVQFLVFAFIHHNLGPRFDALALRSPTALVLSELISVRVFHWHYGHTQVSFTPLVQVASIGGAMLVSFLMFWLAEAAVRAVVWRERRWSFLAPVAAVALGIGYGVVTIHAFSAAPGVTQEVVLVQGNSTITDDYDPDTVERDIRRLHELSRQAARANALMVWPEGSIPAYIPAGVGRIDGAPTLPFNGDGSAFLVGAYAFDGPAERYNSAFAVFPDGRVPRPYGKQILIPFGEFMPLASVFPWLNQLNPRANVFKAGHEATVFEIPMRRGDGPAYTLKVAPLICYEDTVPALSRKATTSGAELLVNLTFDTWFGRSVAAEEHHLIASFRAIENRRFLVRATNSGTSAVVDPLGRTIARIPAFTEGTVAARVRLMKGQTLYTTYVGETPWWSVLSVTLAVIVVRRWRGLPPVAVPS